MRSSQSKICFGFPALTTSATVVSHTVLQAVWSDAQFKKGKKMQAPGHCLIKDLLLEAACKEAVS